MKAIWMIDIDPPCTAEEAALEAFLIMQRRGTSANCFTILDDQERETEIDLGAVWEDPKAFERDRQRALRETRYYLVAEDPGDVGQQVSGPKETREACDSALAELRVMAAPGTRFFRVEINPFSVAVFATSPTELQA